ncbi:hypothetical protein RA280_14735 [Cupriavidus sp. CV2]|uniref:hypothetical protein n=1 Tax=Cupriavidus ulmosensis TaxID=3065913 RepID=UPI00296B41C8|nr:hypothetical protein [Cupriavidus sp. CV2]MDW3682981.1 hypothetical protein [Cupriavidus sp. CV2]
MTAWNPWSPEEEALLRKHWGNGEPTKAIAILFPTRSAAAVLKHGYDMGLGPRECRRPSFSPVWEGIKHALAGSKKMTSSELAALLKVTPHAVQKQMKLRHGNEVRVGGFDVRAHAPHVIRWALGAGPDVPAPKRKSRKEVNRAFSRRMRKDPEYCARQNQRARLRYAERRGKLIRRDPAAAWL